MINIWTGSKFLYFSWYILFAGVAVICGAFWVIFTYDIGISLYVYVYVCVCVHVCACVYVCMYVCICVCMRVCMCTCVYVCAYVCVYTCIHVCVHWPAITHCCCDAAVWWRLHQPLATRPVYLSVPMWNGPDLKCHKLHATSEESICQNSLENGKHERNINN